RPYGGYEYPQQGAFVPPDMMQQQQPYTGQIFQPSQGYAPASAQSFYGSNFEDEPPLLEELGINFDHIWQKTLTVLHPLKVADGSIMNETDLAGPMVFCLAFGATLLLGFSSVLALSASGTAFHFCLKFHIAVTVKTHFGVAPTGGFTQGSQEFSSFCLPRGMMGIVLTAGIIGWCSFSASKIFISALAMEGQQLLVAYPCALLYGVFALISVF
ncbi:YIPF5 protein, partial [Erythrocercus mccallii]|nr:YIPF5 protein [Erythrocercus mccallii]